MTRQRQSLEGFQPGPMAEPHAISAQKAPPCPKVRA